MAEANASTPATDQQLINNDFVLELYQGSAYIYFNVRNNVQAVLDKIKKKGYDRNLINQLMVALHKGSEKKIEELRNTRKFSYPGRKL